MGLLLPLLSHHFESFHEMIEEKKVLDTKNFEVLRELFGSIVTKMELEQTVEFQKQDLVELL